MPTHSQSAIDHFEQQRTGYLEALEEWLAIPSISTDPRHSGEMRRAAEWAAAFLREAGCQEVELIGPESHPAVRGALASGREDTPAALVYGHYDVQPTDPDGEWQSPPFTPTIRGERLYARGAADMKGPAFSTLCALHALRSSGAQLAFDVRILLEGEEEIGSPHLATTIEEHREALRCDFCLNPDSGMLGPELPTLSTAVRGIATFDLEVGGPPRDLHSGEFGGAVHNPAQILCELLAGLHDGRGRVALPGFYDRVRELGDRERTQLAELPLDEAFFLGQAGVEALWGEAGYSAVERVGARPTLEIHGLRSGFGGEGSKTIIPATAAAKLSTRLVPDQDPELVREQLASYLENHAPPTISWRLAQTGSVPPAESSTDSPWAARMIRALTLAWGRPPLLKRVGGTIPIVPLLQRALGVDSVNVGWALPDGNLHAPNENLHLPTFFRGVEALIRFLTAGEA